MIVEPVPTNPRSPLRRGLRLAGVALPLALLVAVVAAGALGPSPAVVVPPDASRTPIEALTDTRPAPAPPSRPVVRRQPADFPALVAGLQVRSVAETLAARRARTATGIVAVAGYLSLGALPWTCLDEFLDPPGPSCIGRTLMRDWFQTWGQLGPGQAGVGTDLLPRFEAGTRGPIPDPGRDLPRSEPLPVVLLGSFEAADDTGCAPAGSACPDAFIVERVAWVAGKDWNVTLTVDPALNVEPNIPEIQVSVRDAVARLGPGTLVTATAVVLPGALAAIDAGAAAALPPIPDLRRRQPVTYVRGLLPDAGPAAAVDGAATLRWVVLDSISGKVLAGGERAGGEPRD